MARVQSKWGAIAFRRVPRSLCSNGGLERTQHVLNIRRREQSGVEVGVAPGTASMIRPSVEKPLAILLPRPHVVLRLGIVGREFARQGVGLCRRGHMRGKLIVEKCLESAYCD